MNLLTGKSVLFLGAHPDDEIGCAGTLHEACHQEGFVGRNMNTIFFSPCLESMPETVTEQSNLKLFMENAASMRFIGIHENNVQRFDFPVRRFPEFRQTILEELIKFKKEKGAPDVVIMPSLNSQHQDHKTLAEEAVRAFPHSTLLAWTLWFEPSAGLTQYPPAYSFIKKASAHVALQCMLSYKSQAHRWYMDPIILMEKLEFNSLESGLPTKCYAEKFEVIRLML